MVTDRSSTTQNLGLLCLRSPLKLKSPPLVWNRPAEIPNHQAPKTSLSKHRKSW